ncbi:hypothetical protein ACWCPQ_06900 [Nocardia sp. NPDC001965]
MTSPQWQQIARRLLDAGESVAEFAGERVIRPTARGVDDAAHTFVAGDGTIVSNRFTAPPERHIGHPIHTSAADGAASDRLLQNVYGDLYHTDHSAVSAWQANELVIRLPAELHFKMRDFMGDPDHRANGYNDPGIWLGDSDILDLGHQFMNRHNWPFIEMMRLGGNDVERKIAGVYIPDHRALLLGNQSTRSQNMVLHEYGHGTDHLLSRMSADKDNYIRRVHIPALRDIIENGSPKASDAIDRWIEKPGETWAEGFSWYYDKYDDLFYDSRRATKLMSEYFSEVDSMIKS